jgi:hypothetical protein
MRSLFVLALVVAYFTIVPSSLAQGPQTEEAKPRPGGDSVSKRIALVVGNSAYKRTPKLANPSNDAADISRILRFLGFVVIDGLDLDKAAFDRKLREFAGALGGADAGVFFYAGHGLQVNGQNYLVPVDAQLTTASALDLEMVRVDFVQRIMESETQTNILFLDACRDNPLARNLARALGTRSIQIGRGLAAIESGAGTLISFSTQPGNVALDGTDRNSPFTGALVKRLQSMNDDLSSVLIAVRNDVMSVTERKQVPWEHSALTGRFYFGTVPAHVANIPPDLLPPAPKGPFDGVWQVEIIARTRCPFKSLKYPLVITDSVLYFAAKGKNSGKIQPDGKFAYTSQARLDPSITTYFSGKLGGDGGTGSFRGGGSCVGTLKITKRL